ncbi:hypothetical protein DFS34DRAFT_591682 [Phlyctochytrium arcticum]|nr:hypothetical protein DFS34DRAFT_591682 [Phlyctochytrium arcticum]
MGGQNPENPQRGNSVDKALGGVGQHAGPTLVKGLSTDTRSSEGVNMCLVSDSSEELSTPTSSLPTNEQRAINMQSEQQQQQTERQQQKEWLEWNEWSGQHFRTDPHSGSMRELLDIGLVSLPLPTGNTSDPPTMITAVDHVKSQQGSLSQSPGLSQLPDSRKQMADLPFQILSKDSGNDTADYPVPFATVGFDSLPRLRPGLAEGSNLSSPALQMPSIADGSINAPPMTTSGSESPADTLQAHVSLASPALLVQNTQAPATQASSSNSPSGSSSGNPVPGSLAYVQQQREIYHKRLQQQQAQQAPALALRPNHGQQQQQIPASYTSNNSTSRINPPYSVHMPPQQMHPGHLQHSQPQLPSYPHQYQHTHPHQVQAHYQQQQPPEQPVLQQQQHPPLHLPQHQHQQRSFTQFPTTSRQFNEAFYPDPYHTQYAQLPHIQQSFPDQRMVYHQVPISHSSLDSSLSSYYPPPPIPSRGMPNAGFDQYYAPMMFASTLASFQPQPFTTANQTFATGSNLLAPAETASKGGATGANTISSLTSTALPTFPPSLIESQGQFAALPSGSSGPVSTGYTTQQAFAPIDQYANGSFLPNAVPAPGIDRSTSFSGLEKAFKWLEVKYNTSTDPPAATGDETYSGMQLDSYPVGSGALVNQGGSASQWSQYARPVVDQGGGASASSLLANVGSEVPASTQPTQRFAQKEQAPSRTSSVEGGVKYQPLRTVPLKDKYQSEKAGLSTVPSSTSSTIPGVPTKRRKSSVANTAVAIPPDTSKNHKFNNSTLNTTPATTSHKKRNFKERESFCVACFKPLARLQLYGSDAQMAADRYVSDVTCMACTAQSSGPLDEPVLKSRRKRLWRNPRERVVRCDVCKGDLGVGGFRVVRGEDVAVVDELERRIKEANEANVALTAISDTPPDASHEKPKSVTDGIRGEWIEPEFGSEYICLVCCAKYAFCTECGGGNKHRTGKWRPIQLFASSRKTCLLPHIRLGNGPFEYTTWNIPAELFRVHDANFIDQLLRSIRALYVEGKLVVLATPRYMEQGENIGSWEQLMKRTQLWEKVCERIVESHPTAEQGVGSSRVLPAGEARITESPTPTSGDTESAREGVREPTTRSSSSGPTQNPSSERPDTIRRYLACAWMTAAKRRRPKSKRTAQSSNRTDALDETITLTDLTSAHNDKSSHYSSSRNAQTTVVDDRTLVAFIIGEWNLEHGTVLWSFSSLNDLHPSSICMKTFSMILERVTREHAENLANHKRSRLEHIICGQRKGREKHRDDSGAVSTTTTAEPGTPAGSSHHEDEGSGSSAADVRGPGGREALEKRFGLLPVDQYIDLLKREARRVVHVHGRPASYQSQPSASTASANGTDKQPDVPPIPPPACFTLAMIPPHLRKDYRVLVASFWAFKREYELAIAHGAAMASEKAAATASSLTG